MWVSWILLLIAACSADRVWASSDCPASGLLTVHSPSPNRAFYGRELRPGFLQITGESATGVDLPELADPLIRLQPDGKLLVTGSAHLMKTHFAYEFPSLPALAHAGPYYLRTFDMRYPNGHQLAGFYKHGWDTTLEPWGVVYAGVIPETAPAVRWDEVNADRDVYPFVPARSHSLLSRLDLDRVSEAQFFSAVGADLPSFPSPESGPWVQLKSSIFFDPAHSRTPGNFLGHRYGHRFLRIRGRLFVFYEEVTEVNAKGEPVTTCLMAREMRNPLRAFPHAVRLGEPTNPRTGRPYPATIRGEGSTLMEGPSPALIGDMKHAVDLGNGYFLDGGMGAEYLDFFFSAGDFFGRYGIHQGWVRVDAFLAAFALGQSRLEVQFALRDDGNDLFDLGDEVTAQFQIRMGLARPTPVYGPGGELVRRRDGSILMTGHGVYQPKLNPDGSPLSAHPSWHSHRNIFLFSLADRSSGRNRRWVLQ